MPAFRNARPSRQSGRLEPQIPVACDSDGWQVPIAASQDFQQQSSPPHSPGAYFQSSHHTQCNQGPTSPSPSCQAVARAEFEAVPSPAPAAPSAFLGLPAFGSSTVSSFGQPYPRRCSHSRRRQPGHIPRPRNAFIIFRSWTYENKPIQTTPEGKTINQNEFSKIVGATWKAMSVEEKAPFQALYDEELKQHKLMYPDYHFEPTNKKVTKKKRGSQPKRKKALSREVDIDSESDWESSSSSRLAGPSRLPIHSPRPCRGSKCDVPSPSPSSSPSICGSVYGSDSDQDAPSMSSGAHGLEDALRRVTLNGSKCRNTPKLEYLAHPSTTNFEPDALFGFTAHPVANVPDMFHYANAWLDSDFDHLFTNALFADALDGDAPTELDLASLSPPTAYPSFFPGYTPLYDSDSIESHTFASAEQTEGERAYDEFLTLYTNVNENA